MTKAIRRLGCERIEGALKCLKESNRANAIHCARKDIKKARAVFRLVRTRIAKKDFRRLIDTLRKAAAYLAAPRDAHVEAQAVRDLTRHFKGQLAPGALRHVRAELRKSRDEELKRFEKEKRVKAFERTLRRALKPCGNLKVSGKGWRALGPGVKTIHRQGRRAFQRVMIDPSSANFHQWRKRVKDLWYHVRLLHPVWPEQMEAVARELEMLGQGLGEDHDLVVLRQDLERRSIPNPQELQTLNGLIEQRQRELRADALELGARFYAEKSSAFCDRLAGYWQTWRSQKKSPARPAIATA